MLLNSKFIFTDDAPKSKIRSQAQRRKDKAAVKTEARESDTSASRGFSTDQRINIEAINVHARRLEHQKSETRMVGLSIQQSAIDCQISSAEARALIRCPDYDPSNIYWKRVDELILDQAATLQTIKDLSNSLLSNTTEQSPSTQISEFLNQPSPQLSTSVRSYTEMTKNDTNRINFEDIKEVTYEVKKEKIIGTTKDVSVSSDDDDDEVCEEV